MRVTLALSSALLLPLMAVASNCQVGTAGSYYAAPAYQTHSYHQYQYQPPVLLQLYGAGYSQQSSPELLSLLDKLERLATATEAIAAGQGRGVGLALGQAPKFVEILQRECSSCHSTPNPKGKFAMFQAGQFTAADPAAMEAIVDRIGELDPARRMPPGKQMAYPDFLEVRAAQRAMQSKPAPGLSRGQP